MLSNHPGTRTGTQSKFRFSFFLLFVSFFFLFHFFTCGYPKGFVMGFNIQMCHLLTLCWQRLLFGSRTHGPISKQHSSLLPKGPWVVYSLMHSRPMREPWEWGCHAHILCESINTGWQFFKSCLCSTSILIINNGAV